MTAVDFFKEELEKELEFKAVEKFWYGLYQQAKEMEKEQIVRAIDNVYFDKDGNEMTGEDYYNTTFKSE